MSNAPSLLDRWFAAVRSGSPDAFRDICTDDVVLYWNGDPAVIPWAGAHKGPDAVAAFFSTLKHHIEVQSVALDLVTEIPGGALVTLAGRWRVRDTETIIEARAANILRYRDGRVCGYDVYNDTAKFAAALSQAASA
jgi:ketosteroid isomerase-like protein